ncbi:hypothetical protein ACH5RR_012351 [Cinchona calisaya]|uniref:Uncharacterized protein n=1 Tax=Cinchona calisaya TaxID=153742 RepID=A0ABD3A902_9GENT
MSIMNQVARPLGVSKENDGEENQVLGQSRKTTLESAVQEKVQEGSQVVVQAEEPPILTAVEAFLAIPHSREAQISNPPKDRIGLTTSDRTNLEDKDPVGLELTSSKDDKTTSDHLGNRMED